jgi:hypothetical protein
MRRAILGTSLLLLSAAALPAQSPEGGGAAWEALERRAAAIRPVPDEVRWQQLPWIVEPKEAIAAATAEHRPIFFWAAGGRGRDGLPLERC